MYDFPPTVPLPPVASVPYRGEEYSVVQGIGGHIWKWSTTIAGVEAKGQAHSTAGAVAAAEKAIDRALAVKKVRLVPPQGAD